MSRVEDIVLVLVLEWVCDVESKMWTGAWGFVPEGLNDSSLAIYCQEIVQKRGRL